MTHPSELGGGNGTGRIGTAPMAKACGQTEPRDDIYFEDLPDNLIRPDDSTTCVDGPPDGDDDEQDVGLSDILEDSESWIQHIRAWRKNIPHAFLQEEDLEGGSSSSGSSSGSCSESSTMVDEDALCGKETVIADIVAFTFGGSVIIEASPQACDLL